MKRTLLLLLAICIGTLTYAQKRASISSELQNQAVKAFHMPAFGGDEIIDMPINYNTSTKGVNFDEEIIGATWFDLQSNSLLGNRITMHDDGTVGAVWTMGFEATGYLDRGTGYNYFDGTTWGVEPTIRVEDSIRTGWPSYAAWGEQGEIIVSHDYALGHLIISKRDEKGTGEWSHDKFYGPNSYMIGWPRVTTSGENNEHIHLIYITFPVANGGQIYEGMDGALLYSRSMDGGLTWDIENVQLEGTTIDNYFYLSADEYIWAEPRVGVIAFVVADAWHDMFIMKSADNGDSWEKKMVWEHPYPFFDWDVTITTDTIWCCDNSADIAIDNDGVVHLVSGIGRVAHTEVGTNYSFWPYTDGIAYWNDTRDPFENENQHRALDPYTNLVEDHSVIGWMQDVDGDNEITLLEELMSYREIGLSTMPNISVGPDNQLFVSFASTTETFDNGTYNFKHIWVRRSPDNGTTWGNFYDLNNGLVHIFDECIYPVMAGSLDGNLHLIYNADAGPGTAQDEDHDHQENSMYYVKYAVDEFTDISSNDALLNDANVSQNMPNPFNTTSVVRVELKDDANLSLDVINLMGQHVFTLDRGDVNSGTHYFTIDGADLPSGIYFYTVKANESTITRKMIVE